MIEIGSERLEKRQPGRGSIHHVQPLDAGLLVHHGVHIVAARAPGHEPGDLHLARKAFVQGLLPIGHRRPRHAPAAGLPHQGLQIGDEDRDLALGRVAACVRDGDGQLLIALLLPVGGGIEAVGQGGNVAGAPHQALRRQGLARPDIGDRVDEGTHRRHRVGDREGRLVHLALGLHLDDVDPGHGGVHGGHVRHEPARHGVGGQKGRQGRHRLPRLDGQPRYRPQDGADGLDEGHVSRQVLQPDDDGPLPRLMEGRRLLEGHAHQLGVRKVLDEPVRPQLLVHAQRPGDASSRGGRGVLLADQGDPGPAAAGNPHHCVPGPGPVDLAGVEGVGRLAPVLHQGGGRRATARHLPHRHRAHLPIQQEKGADGQPHQEQQPLQQEPEPMDPMHLWPFRLLHRRASINIRSYHRRKRPPCQ